VTGHRIVDLQGETEVVMVDAGTEVRLCREHGAPVRVEVRDSAAHPVLDR
jgi:hypothetical protein